MNLYLMRHANAGIRRGNPAIDDKRSLVKEGKDQCMMMARMLSESPQLVHERLDRALAAVHAAAPVSTLYFAPSARAETIAQTEGLEFVPRRIYQHRGATFEDMDTAAVIARHPEVAVVDDPRELVKW